ncbi:MAG: hypothetical protein WEB58_03755 [Planctomycetaceae bacterium]
MPHRRTWLILLAVAAVAFLGVCCAWTLSTSATGWRPHLASWTGAVREFVGITETPLGDSEPAVQGRFWLDQVAQLSGGDIAPHVAMGAAWMLDGPEHGFIKHHLRRNDLPDMPGIPLGARIDLDQETINRLFSEFESMCREECLAQIERALLLDNDDVELWRARALLLFPYEVLREDNEPRQNDWLAVLNECSGHDPGNALYDYLAALHLWQASATYDYDGDLGGYTLTATDQEMFNRGVARFNAGLAKPHLKFGTEGYAATLAFLETTPLSPYEQLTTAGSRAIIGKTNNLLLYLMRWQSVRRDVAERSGDLDGAVQAVRAVLPIVDQIEEAGNPADVLSSQIIFRRWCYANLKKLGEEHPHLLTAEEQKLASSELDKAQLDFKVFEEAAKRLKAKTSRSVEPFADKSFTWMANFISLAALAIAPSFVLLSLGFAFVAWLCARPWKRTFDAKSTRLRLLPFVTPWLIGSVISFVFLGMLPAQLVSPTVQTSIVAAAIGMVFLLCFGGMLFVAQRQTGVPTAQFAALAATVTLTIIAGLHFSSLDHWSIALVVAVPPLVLIVLTAFLAWAAWTIVRLLVAFVRSAELTRSQRWQAVGMTFAVLICAVPLASRLAVTMANEFEARAWIQPTVWKEARALPVDADKLQSAMKLDDHPWLWALLQWRVNFGLTAMIVIATGIVWAWTLFRLRKHPELPHHNRAAAVVVAKSCLVASSLSFIVYLATVPTMSAAMDETYRDYYDRLIDAPQMWSDVNNQIDEIEADETLMTKFHAEIDERRRELDEQEIRFKDVAK